MPADLWNGAVRMAGCGLVVAAVAIPVAIVARYLAHKQGERLLPRPRRWPVPWTGLELLFLFPFAALAPMSLVDPLLASGGFYQAVYGADTPEMTWQAMRPLWAAVFFIPAFAAVLFLLRAVLYRDWKPEPRAVPARTALGVQAWFLIHPPVWVVFFIVSILFAALSWTPDEHPLEKSFGEGRPPIDQVLLLVQASLLTPLLEELLFRGLLLPWILSRKYRIGLILLVSAALAIPLGMERRGGVELMIGPVAFAFVLLAGWLPLRSAAPGKRRSFGAVYASSVFFAVVHSNVWPTPIPLFVLGLGLGWLALRTRGILAPIIVHGLFNAVSVLFVLRD